MKTLARKLRTAFHVVASDLTLKSFFKVIRIKFSRYFELTQERWKPRSSIGLRPTTVPNESQKMALVVHLHYKEYVDVLKSALTNFPFPFDLFISISSKDISAHSFTDISPLVRQVIIREVPNRGRNFGPLFVEFGQELKNYDLVIHVHSKKSINIDPEFAASWSRELWQSLLADPVLISKVMQIFQQNSEIGIYYPLPSVLSLKVFNWETCESMAKEWGLKHGIAHMSGRIPFPAGGMFWFRPAALMPILNAEIAYSDFPEEVGQSGGTFQHALERLVGTVPITMGFKHLVYHVRAGILTTDISYVGRRFSSRSNYADRSAK